MLELPPLSLYIHIPWCVQKCPYCDFNSHQNSGELPEAPYLAALKQDLLNDLPYAQGRKIHSIFFGGGTPSLMSANTIAGILEYVEKVIGFEKDIEITLEANPGTFEQDKFSGFHAAGVNRLSLGVQSFQASHLEKLGRIHSAQEAQKAIKAAHQTGFKELNIDLMHGLPNQTLEEAQDDLRIALDLNTNHLSWYQLTIEPNTVFYRSPPILPDDDRLADIQDHGHELLRSAGFEQYEISAYTKGNTPSKHNMNYWQFGDYLGIGAGAHGKVTLPNDNRIIRTQKTRLPQHYLDRHKQNSMTSFRTAESPIEASDLPLEFFMNALRLSKGVPSYLFERRTGLVLASQQKQLNQLQQQGLMQSSENRLSTTELGARFLNAVLAQWQADTTEY